MKKSPYKDKKGTPIFEGDRIIGSTNFDKVQATVLFDANKKNDYESWLIQIDKHLENDKWIDHSDFRSKEGFANLDGSLGLTLVSVDVDEIKYDYEKLSYTVEDLPDNF